MSTVEETKSEFADTIKATLQGEKDLPKFPDDESAQERARVEMIKVMGEMEQARERVGNYCVTIGKGDERVILLMKYNRNDFYSSQSGEHKYRDYTCITADGPKTLMIYERGTDPWKYDDQFIADLDRAEREGKASLYSDGILYNPRWGGNETWDQFEARRNGVPEGVQRTLLDPRTNEDFRFFNWGINPDRVSQTIQDSIELVQESVVKRHSDTVATTQNLSTVAANIQTVLK